jgi:hypothetical protein
MGGDSHEGVEDDLALLGAAESVFVFQKRASFENDYYFYLESEAFARKKWSPPAGVAPA